MTITLHGHPGVGPVVEGEVLVSHHGFSARYDLDRRVGVFSRRTHDLYGQSLVGKVLVCPVAKGGVATAWALHDLKVRGVAPVAILFRRTNPIMVQGAVHAGLALLDQLDPDPVSALHSGDWVRVSPATGTVEVLRPATG